MPTFAETSRLAAYRRKIIWLTSIWIILLIAAASLDRTVALNARQSGLEKWVRSHSLVRKIVKAPGVYYFTLIVSVAALFIHPLQWRAALFLVLSGVTGLLNSLMKWSFGRTRPYKLDEAIMGMDLQPGPFVLHPFRDGLMGLFNPKNLAFPSGHTSVAFATAAALAILWPRWTRFFYIGAVLVALERVAENAHYLSDTIAAAGVSVAVVYVIWWYGRPLFRSMPVARPVLNAHE
jgi:membrane-associated phospholipid phosphatase